MRTIKSPLKSLTILLLVFSGCNQEMDQEQEALEAVDELYETYVQSAEARDLETFMTCWDEQGMRAEPGLPTIIGKENIRARFEEIFSAPVDFEITPVGDPLLHVSGEFVISYRTVTLTSTPRDGSPPLIEDMNVLTIIRQQDDGSWKSYIDCINFHPTWSMDTIPEGLMEDNPYY